MTNVLSQIGELTPVQRAVREQFATGGSVTTVLAVVTCIAAALLFAYILTRCLRAGRREESPVDKPRKLFADLLRRPEVADHQREILSRVAADLDLQHPAAILLSAAFFDHSVARWRENEAKTGRSNEAETTEALMAEVRRALFSEAA